MNVLVLFVVGIGLASAQRTDTCSAHVEVACLSPGKAWVHAETCSAVYGGFLANEDNLRKLMKYHLEDSFKFMLMVNFVFNSELIF